MQQFETKTLLRWGGLCGILGTLCYASTKFIGLGSVTLYLLVMAWPILSVIFAYGLYRYVAHEKPSIANDLALIFACLGFTLVAVMASVQLAVRMGIEDYIFHSPEQEDTYKMILRSIRLVDHGIDVAWDMFIGISLVFLTFALKGHPKFRLVWALPAALLGIWLMAFNAATFPWPPYTRGLFDIGPIIGVYIILLSSRMVWLSTGIKQETLTM